MGNVEILGRPKYGPFKVRLRNQFNPLNQLKSKESNLPLTYEDLVYERYVADEKPVIHRDI